MTPTVPPGEKWPTPRIDPTDVQLPLGGGHTYFADPQLIAAINAALLLGRPLLLTGEPGSGKSCLAQAVDRYFRHHWQGNPSVKPEPDGKLGVCIVRSDSQARDLLYLFDSIARFGDAQLDDTARSWAKNPRNYLSLEPLGAAIVSGKFSVVLVDEIDKSPRDLPNDLLDVVEEQQFQIREIPEIETPEYIDHIGTPQGWAAANTRRWMRPPGREKARGEQRLTAVDGWPLIIITSNTERQLPHPFLRRCVCHHIPRFGRERLMKIASDRFQALMAESSSGEGAGASAEGSVGVKLVDLFQHLQELRLEKPPGTSELVDALGVLERERRVAHPSEWKQISSRLERLMATAKAGRNDDSRQREKEHDWRSLPFFSCLVKLERDIRVLTGSPA